MKKIVIPAVSGEGLAAPASEHFGGAPFFVVFDAESRETTVMPNPAAEHVHGACNPVAAISDVRPDAVLCRGMGARAVMLLNQAGIMVFRVEGATAGDLVAAWEQGHASVFSVTDACTGHSCEGASGTGG